MLILLAGSLETQPGATFWVSEPPGVAGTRGRRRGPHTVCTEVTQLASLCGQANLNSPALACSTATAVDKPEQLGLSGGNRWEALRPSPTFPSIPKVFDVAA